MVCNDIVLYRNDKKRNNQNKEIVDLSALTKVTIILTIIL